jgi:hypothetical protein
VPLQAGSILAPFIPQGYDVYVLGVQEGVSDAVFDAVATWTGAFRLPLHTKLYRNTGGGSGGGDAEHPNHNASASSPPPAHATNVPSAGARSRRIGRAIVAQSFLDDARAGAAPPEPVSATADMLDRVWGRGDGALLTPKFTGACGRMEGRPRWRPRRRIDGD